ncbi:MAG TPA: alcohol dehydrogenase [Sedimenticola sp.]|nr:alcohol dehydrogenase [Sedimenticola sp.]
MRAVEMTKPGPPDVLQLTELVEPQIQSDTQIKVRIKAAGVNPIDTKIRKDAPFYPDDLPAVLGCDGAGVVAEVGSAVTRFKPGDAVWFCNGGLGREQGTYAQFTLLEEAHCSPKPKSLSFAEAAAAPLVLITAWEALFERGRIQPGHTVLIHAGGGGVGHVAIQLAKRGGAKIITTVADEDKAMLAQEMGADEFIFYRDRDFVDAVNTWTNGKGVNIALDTVGPETFRRTISAMAFGGSLVTLLNPGPDIDWTEARNRNLNIGFELMLTPQLRNLPAARAHHSEILRRCEGWIDTGKLKIHVSHKFPLEEAAQAHRLIEKGHVTGKVVLVVEDWELPVEVA